LLPGKVSSLMRVLITGGTGLIAGRLGESFIKKGYDVVIANRREIEVPEAFKDGKTVVVNWNDASAIEDLCRNCDVIIHTAGMNASDCAKNPTEALRFNGVVTTALVQAAVAAAVKKFLYLSTAHVYSGNLSGLISEATCPQNLHPYATSHRAAEDSVLFASTNEMLDGMVLRLSNIVGTPLTKDTNCWQLIVNDVCRQAATTRKIVLKTDGSQTRDFLAISELNLMIEYLLNCAAPLRSRIINVGSEESTTILSIAQLVQSRCQSVLGFRPELVRPSNTMSVVKAPLNFQTTVLDSLGYKRTESLSAEIDKLLLFCSLEFAT
jgi:UDP-glucose 4-epimerase